MQTIKNLEEAVEAYEYNGTLIEVKPYGSGHINDTFLVRIDENGSEKRYILQRLNRSIFKRPEEVMENITAVTGYLQAVLTNQGSDPKRETLCVVRTREQKDFYKDLDGEYWRCFLFIENTICLQQIDNPQQFYNSAKSFGRFLRQLKGYPAETLHETIKNFHDTPKRFQNLMHAIEVDSAGRVESVQNEIDFIVKRRNDMNYLEARKKTGELPIRVTHNDTKLNNILLDENTGEGICIIDLDTIMPGLAAYDFGDAIRFGAATAVEDEPDLSKVHFSLPLYQIYKKGYLEQAGQILTEAEKESLPWGAKLMTLECGMRFLTDYLEGDHYFKTTRNQQNLDRTRTQLKLVYEMEQNWNAMNH